MNVQVAWNHIFLWFYFAASQLNQSKEEQVEYIADEYEDLGVRFIDDEGFENLDHITENAEGGVEDDDIVVTSQAQHKQNSNAEIGKFVNILWGMCCQV